MGICLGNIKNIAKKSTSNGGMSSRKLVTNEGPTKPIDWASSYNKKGRSYSGFFMKYFLNVLVHARRRLETYFLPNFVVRNELSPQVYLSDEEDILERATSDSKFAPSVAYAVVVLPAFVDAPGIMNLAREVIVISPRVLEDVLALIEKTTTALGAEDVLVVCAHLSKISMQSDEVEPIKATNYQHEPSMARLLFALARWQRGQSYRLVIVDHEATMGKKNSALVRRLFLRTQYY